MVESLKPKRVTPHKFHGETLSENFGYPRPAPKPTPKTKKGRKPKAAENSETNSGE